MNDIQAKKARLLKKQEKLERREKALLASQGPAASSLPPMTFQERLKAFSDISALGDSIPKRVKRGLITQVCVSSGIPVDEAFFKKSKKQKTPDASAPVPATLPEVPDQKAAPVPAPSAASPPASVPSPASVPATAPPASVPNKNAELAKQVKGLLNIPTSEAVKA